MILLITAGCAFAVFVIALYLGAVVTQAPDRDG